MKTEDKPYILEINKVLEKLLFENKISSYRENPHVDPKSIKLIIHFKYNGKTLEVSPVIDTRKYDQNTNWYSNFVNILEGRKKGEDAEDRIFKLLLSWKRTRKCGVCEVYRSSEHFNHKEKADIMVIINHTLKAYQSGHEKAERSMVRIQIKSSKYYQSIHKQKNPWNASMVINDKITDEMILEKFKKVSTSAIIILQMNLLLQLLKDSDPENMKKIELMRQKYSNDLHQ